MNLRTLSAALAALACLACGFEPVSEDRAASTAGTGQIDALKQKGPGSISMRVRTADSQSGAFGTTFSIDATYDVYFAFDLPSSKSGSHRAAFEVFMPGGLPYQRTELPFAAGQAAVSPEVQAELISGGFRVWSSMPVAGTMIQQSALTGRWSVKVWLDGALVASSTFTLEP